MKIGVGITSWNRPNYLKRLLDSLEKNNSSEAEFHLFQDGSVCRFTGQAVAKDKDISESMLVFRKSLLPRKQIHWQIDNVGVGINEFEAMRYLSRVYRYYIFLEDDVVVSPNFITLMKRVLIQFENDKRIACISPSFRPYCKESEIEENIDKLIFSAGHFWAEACWGEKYKEIEKEHLPYYSIIETRPHHSRDEGKILALFENTGLPNPNGNTSQDAGRDWAIKRTSMRKARFVVNRATGIGDYGIYGTPEKLKATGDGHNPVYSSDNELAIKEFKLVEL